MGQTTLNTNPPWLHAPPSKSPGAIVMPSGHTSAGVGPQHSVTVHPVFMALLGTANAEDLSAGDFIRIDFHGPFTAM